MTLEKLMPLTKYVVHVELTNIYLPLSIITPKDVLSHFTTKAGGEFVSVASRFKMNNVIFNSPIETEESERHGNYPEISPRPMAGS